jgi:hypothetical protein
MPYIDRDAQNHIVGVYECKQYEGQEFAETAQLYVDPDNQKKDLLAIARDNRQTLIDRLTWLRVECRELLEVAQAASNAPEVALQTANLAAIRAATNSLVNAFDDPRVVNSVNGAAKQAVQIVYAEIVLTFKNAAPVLFNRFKKLDAL